MKQHLLVFRGRNLMVFLLLSTGVFMSAFQFIFNRGLWTDEAALAINIISRDYIGLTRPLDTFQIAPILYLWLVKTSILLLPPSEWSLRLLSFLAYLVSLFLFWRILQRLVKDKLAVYIGLALFVFNNKLWYYSSEIKQYMTDVMVALVMLYLVVEGKPGQPRRMLWLTIAGVVSIYFTNVAVVILPMVALFILLEEREPLRAPFLTSFLFCCVAWGVAFLFNYFLFLHDHPSKPHQQILFAQSFPPTEVFSRYSLAFFEHTFSVLKRDFGFGQNNIHIDSKVFEYVHYGVMLLLLLNFLWQGLRFRSQLLLLCIPLLLHVVLAYLKLYPIAIRIMLYQYPLIAIMAALGAEHWLRAFSSFRKAMTVVVYAGIASLAFLFIRVQLPKELEESRPVFAHIGAHTSKRTPIYCYMAGNSILESYRRIGVFEPPGRILYGVATHDEPELMVGEITSLGSDAWLYFAHFDPGLETQVVGLLQARGYQVTDSARATGTVVFHLEKY